MRTTEWGILSEGAQKLAQKDFSMGSLTNWTLIFQDYRPSDGK